MTEIVTVMTARQAADWKVHVGIAASNLRSVLHRGYKGRAWVALGYESWTDCLRGVAEEFGLTERRLWQLHSANTVEAELNHGSVGVMPERHLRALAEFDPELRPAILRVARAYSSSTGKPVTAGMLSRAGEVIEEAATTGHVDTGSGESTALVAAMHATEFEATKRLQQRQREHYENHDAQGRVVDRRKAFFSFVARFPCLRCGVFGVEVAHVQFLLSRKTGLVLPRRKGAAAVGVVPLCSECHRTGSDSIHNVGEEAFSDALGRGRDYLFRFAASLIVWFFVEGERQ